MARVLKRLGLSRLKNLEKPQVVVRYEWPNPGDLLHLDVKKLGKFHTVGHRITKDPTLGKSRGAGWEFAHVCVDDATRLAYVELLPDEAGESCAGFLLRAVRWFDRHDVRVHRVMTDNGSGYRSKVFQQVREELGFRHIRTRPYTPRTNGKAERFIQTMLREWAYGSSFRNSVARAAALAPWLRHYNGKRPHSSLGAATPLQRLRSAA